MKTLRGPGLFLAQFVGDQKPFDNLPDIATWAAAFGYKGVQIPTLTRQFFDLDTAAESQAYCDDMRGMLAERGLEVTELSTHIQGQLVAVHPTYAAQFDGFAPEHLRGKPREQQAWAIDQLMKGAVASRRFGHTAHVTFSGALAWPFVYPWPQRPPDLVDEAFAELARLWRPILDKFDEQGIDLCFELHPCEDLFDGATFEMFLERVGNHPRCCVNYDASHFIKQGLDYLAFIDIFHDRIKMFHVKDAEFNPTGRQGMFSGYQPWLKRAARDRSLGDGQVNFKAIFSKLAEYDYDGWAVYEWEDCLMAPAEAARRGAPFIAEHIIQVTDKVFDDFASTGSDRATTRRMLGLG